MSLLHFLITQCWLSWTNTLRDREPGRSHIAFYYLALDIMPCYFYCILVIRRQSLRLVHIKREGNPIPSFNEVNVQTCFKTTSSYKFCMNIQLAKGNGTNSRQCQESSPGLSNSWRLFHSMACLPLISTSNSCV